MTKNHLLPLITTLTLILCLAACGSNDNRRRAVDVPASEEAAVSDPTPTPIPFEYYEYTYGSVAIGVPLDMQKEPADSGDSVSYSAPDGTWTVRFTPLSVTDKENRYKYLKGNFDSVSSFGYYRNVISDEDRSAAFGGGKFKVSYFSLERNPDWVEATQGYTAFFTEANAFYLIDYGDTMIGPWGGLEIQIAAPEKTTDPIAPIVTDEHVRILTENLEFRESPSTQDISFPGVTAHVPARWQTGTDGKQALWTTIQGDTKGTLYFIADAVADPAAAAGYITPEYRTLEYNGRQWFGEVRTSTLAEETTRTLELYTEFTEYHALAMRLNINDADDDSIYWDFIESQSFKDIMETLEIDASAFHNPEDDRKDQEGFEVNNIGEISAYTGNAAEITIPSQVGETRVTGINTNVFKDNTSITSVVISEGVSYIGGSAFEGCTSLRSVTLPASLTNIGSGAFHGCTSLEDMSFGEGLAEIGGEAFRECTSLKDVLLPASVTKIGSSAFNGAGNGQGGFSCEGDGTVYEFGAFTNAKFASVKIGPNADLSAGSILSGFTGGSVEIGEGCTQLGENFLFDPTGEDTMLTQITLPSGLKAIGNYAFSGRKGLKAVNLGEVDTLGQNAFSGTGLVDIVIPGTVREIPDFCFANCPDVMTITLEEGVETIGEYAFTCCGKHYPDEYWWHMDDESLESVQSKWSGAVANGTDPYDRALDITLPSTLKEIRRMAFSTTFIQGVYMLRATEPSMLPEIDYEAFSSARVYQVYFTKETIDAYGTELDNMLEQLEDVDRVAWYDEGKRTYWNSYSYE